MRHAHLLHTRLSAHLKPTAGKKTRRTYDAEYLTSAALQNCNLLQPQFVTQRANCDDGASVSQSLLTMVREFSAGGVVLRMIRGRWHIATIEPYTERPKKTPKAGTDQKKPHVLALPKGTVDPGEKPRQTAAREVHEETGLRAEIITKLADIKYFYIRSWGDRARVFKVVSFYLFRYVSGKLGNITPEMRHEVQQCFWTPLEDAPKLLSYKGERQMATEAVEYVKAHPELTDKVSSTAE
jgi:8-oxo-dGTP pyrophosphatase MutT (NUDIX family)